MRKLTIGALVGAVFLVTAAVALAVTNTVRYTASIGNAKAAKKPVNVTYKSTLTVAGPNGTQPNAGTVTTIYFAKQLKNNARKFPGNCKQADIQGKQAISAKCNAAFLGTGTASVTAGTPGNEPTNTSTANLRVYNGNGGAKILVAAKVGGAAWQVIPGTFVRTSGKFGQKVNFRVPQALQGPAGNVAVRKLTIKFPKTKTHGGASYVQLKSCPASHRLPTRALVKFTHDDGSPGGSSRSSNGTMSCRR